MLLRTARWIREMAFWLIGGALLLIVLFAGFVSIWGEHPDKIEGDPVGTTTTTTTTTTTAFGSASGTTTTRSPGQSPGPPGPRGLPGETRVIVVPPPTTRTTTTTSTSTTTTTTPPPLVCILGRCA